MLTCVGQLKGFRWGRDKIEFAFQVDPLKTRGGWARSREAGEGWWLYRPEKLRPWTRILAIRRKERMNADIHR